MYAQQTVRHISGLPDLIMVSTLSLPASRHKKQLL